MATTKGPASIAGGPLSEGGQASWLNSETACPPIDTGDFGGIRAMYLATIQRAMHDACGATVVAPTTLHQLKFARQAHDFLYSNLPAHKEDRELVCAMAGIDVETLDQRMAKAAIPAPTSETIKHAWTNLERMYWRLNGAHGPEPVARAERTTPDTRGHGGKRARRRINIHIGEPPKRRTLLFAPPKKGARPVRPKAGSMLAILSQMQMELPLSTGWELAV